MTKIILALLFFLTVSSSLAAAPPVQVEKLTKQFIKLSEAREQPNSTKKNVEAYLNLFSDDFIDEHVKYDFQFNNKKQLKDSLINKLSDEVQYLKITINNEIYGINTAFVEITTEAKVKPAHLDKVVEHTSKQLLSIEFDKAGRVKKVRRHEG